MQILLASASTRRGLILQKRYSDVVQRPLVNVDESVPRGPVSEQVKEVSLRKSNAVSFPVDEDVVVVADTLVEDPDDENAALGQPRDRSHATCMLIRLRGRRHRVWSATSVHALNQWKTSIECAIVEFSDFSDDDLIKSTTAEPTTIPSEIDAIEYACSGERIPKPMTVGRSVIDFIFFTKFR